jgi:WD40 repeat protein
MTLLAAATADNTIWVWRLGDRELIQKLDTDGIRFRSLGFFPDGSLLAGGRSDGTIVLWRTSDWAPARTLTGHNGYVRALALSPDGSLLASGGTDSVILIWRVADGSILHTIRDLLLDPVVLAFSPDGSLLAAASREVDIRVWRVADASRAYAVRGLGRMSCLAISPDGSTLAGGGNSAASPGSGEPEGAIIFWGMGDGARVAQREQEWPVRSLAYTPAGDVLFSADRRGNIQAWRTRDGALLRTFGSPGAWYGRLIVSSDGAWLLASRDDGRVEVWGIP